MMKTRWLWFRYSQFHIIKSQNIPESPAYGALVSQLIRYFRVCAKYEYFMFRRSILVLKWLSQGYSSYWPCYWVRDILHTDLVIESGIFFILTLLLSQGYSSYWPCYWVRDILHTDLVHEYDTYMLHILKRLFTDYDWFPLIYVNRDGCHMGQDIDNSLWNTWYHSLWGVNYFTHSLYIHNISCQAYN